MVIKYTKIFHSKTLQNLPKLRFFVWKQTIWQPWYIPVVTRHGRCRLLFNARIRTTLTGHWTGNSARTKCLERKCVNGPKSDWSETLIYNKGFKECFTIFSSLVQKFFEKCWKRMIAQPSVHTYSFYEAQFRETAKIQILSKHSWEMRRSSVKVSLSLWIDLNFTSRVRSQKIQAECVKTGSKFTTDNTKPDRAWVMG
jgi:hypothetical protein